MFLTRGHFVSYEQANSYTDLDSEHVVYRSRELGVLSNVSAQVKKIYRAEILGQVFAHSIKGSLIYEAVIGHKCHDPLFADAVRCPAYCLYIWVIDRDGKTCLGIFPVRGRYFGIQRAIFSIFVVIVFVHLPGVIRRIAQNDKNRRFFLSPHAYCIFGGHKSERWLLWLSKLECVHKTDSRKWLVLTYALQIFVFDIHAGKIVRQKHDLIAVEFISVLMRQGGGLNFLHHAHDEIASAHEWVENMYFLVA